MVQHSDAYELADLAKPSGKCEVLGRGRGIAAGVVVDKDDSSGRAGNGIKSPGRSRSSRNSTPQTPPAR